MRATLILVLTYVILGLFLCLVLSSALLWVSIAFLLGFSVITATYSDKMVLYFLGAREVGANDQKVLSEAASQAAYKLSVQSPQLYFYNGIMERAFVLQNRKVTSIVISKSLIEKCTFDELCGITFELLLQVKKGMAKKRTKSMFYLGLLAWFFHTIIRLILKLVPMKEAKEAAGWVLNYLLHPMLHFIFGMILGEGYFKRLNIFLGEFPKEKEFLYRASLKFSRSKSHLSLPSRKLLELFSSNKSRHFQRILAFEILPHEWDYFFTHEELLSVK